MFEEIYLIFIDYLACDYGMNEPELNPMSDVSGGQTENQFLLMWPLPLKVRISG